MQLSPIEYDAIMGAINNARNEIVGDTFIDPYAENPGAYTNETLDAALVSIESKLQELNPYN